MKSLATAQALTPAEFNLTVLNGKDKGSVYRLMAPQITLGRGSNCDISFPDDPTCSRTHARIHFTHEGFLVESLSEKNKLTVNGQVTSKALLEDNAEIELGNTKLKFNIVRRQMTPVGPSIPTAPQAANPGVTRVGAWPGQAPASSGRQKSKSKFLTPPRIIMLVVGFLFLYLLLEEPAQKKAPVKIRTEEQIQADIEEANKLKEAVLEENRHKQTNTQAYQEAQSAYVRGFRDYKKGIYGRAMESFQACLSLVPDHRLCTRYLRLSQRRFNELTQYHMVLGRKYRDQNQYSACASAFSNVMIMIRDQNNKTYKEAKANFEACQTQVEGRF